MPPATIASPPSCHPPCGSPVRRLPILGLAALCLTAFAAPAQILIPTEAPWTYRKGTLDPSVPPEAWRHTDFHDSDWTAGRAPFYYDTANVYSGRTLLADMRNNYTTLFLRRTFVIEDLDSLATLDLRHLCDDGFVLWINGTLVHRYNHAGDNFGRTATATAAVPEPIDWLGTTLTSPHAYLVQGTNQAAVLALNTSRTSSDFIFDLELIARPRDTSPPTLAAIDPAPGEVEDLTTVTVTFSEPVRGLAFSDLLLNQRPALGVQGSGTTYRFTVEPPPLGPVAVSWDPGAGITDFADPPNPFDTTAPAATWSYLHIDRTPPALRQILPPPGHTVRQLSRIEVLFSEPVDGVRASDLLVDDQPAAEVAGSEAGPYLFTFPPRPAGPVALRWAGNHAIVDRAPTPNPFSGDPWSYLVDPDLVSHAVRISEFLADASNDAGLRDEDGHTPDWIEIENRGDTPVNLLGWSLTDDPALPGQWVFPDTPLAPGAFLVVFASGKDRRSGAPERPLHTNFRLGLDGEYLALFNAESPRVAVSEFAPAYPPQRLDHSYGYDPDDHLRHFAQPTPGSPNPPSTLAGIVPPVEVNVSRGLFEHPFELHLSSPLDGVTIRYTTDGTPPTAAAGRLYRDPLTISTTTVLRATAFLEGHLPSAPITHTYLFLSQVVLQPPDPPGYPATWIDTQGRAWTADYEMDPEITQSPAYRDRMIDSLRSLPVLSLVARPADLFDNATGIYPKSQARGPSWERAASAEFLDPDTGASHQIDCGVQMQGNSVRDPVKTAKHAFRLVFKRDYGPPKLEHRVFPDAPLAEFNTLTLRADFNNSWMHWDGAQRLRGQRVRDAWIKDSQRAMGGFASHNRFVHLYLNGLYWGIYDPTERPDAAYAESYFGGTREDYDVVNEGQRVDGTMVAYNAMRALSDLASDTQYQRMKEYLDVPAYIDYVLLHFYVGHQDWFTDKNWYAIRRRAPGEGFRFWSWDGELILNSPTQNIVTRTDQASGLHAKMLANPQYRLDFADRAHRHLFHDGALTPDAVADRYRRRIDQVERAMVAESARWGDYRRDVHSYSSGPYLLYTVDEHFAQERDRLFRDYFPHRTGTVLNQLRAAGLYPAVAAPTLAPRSGRIPSGTALSMTAPSGTLYYTLDGSDPRLAPSGAMAPAAVPYTAPIPLTRSTLVKARARLGDTWSALAEATLELDSPVSPLAITEIHYQPLEGDPYEFLELQNRGVIPIDVTGFSFEGIRFIFPPNSILQPAQVVVLASTLSPDAFAQRYPAVAVFGHFSGSLANAGERIALLDRQRRAVTAVTYASSGGWPRSPAGSGPSLERIDFNAHPQSPAAWRSSVVPHGTPGVVPHAPTPTPPPVRLNELMAVNTGSVLNGPHAPDWIELHNAGPAPANLSGWSLSDSSEPRKFVFPTGTSIPPGGYLVVWCDDRRDTPGLHTGFALNRAGETLTLFNSESQRVDAVSFGSQLPDLTLGRTGPDATWTLCQPTPGQPNAPQPLANPGQLALNEWLARPAPGHDPWIELYNRHDSLPASLHGLFLATDTAVAHLPAHTFLAPSQHLLLHPDTRSGPDRVALELRPDTVELALLDASGQSLDRIALTPFAHLDPGASAGRLPDGAPSLTAFPHTASPGLPNALPDPAAPRFHEIAAAFEPGWIELHHPGDSPFDLSGFRLATSRTGDPSWTFPPGTTLQPGAFLLVHGDPAQPATTSSASPLNSRLQLPRRGGSLFLLAPDGRLSDTLAFGFQVPDRTLGHTPDGWTLLATPTPGAPNAEPAPTASPGHLRINEWLAQSDHDNDWIELFNRSDLPVALHGLHLSDHPGLARQDRYAFAPLSFIAGRGFVRIDADNRPQDGPQHARFALAAAGEAIVLTASNGQPIDAVYFGRQTRGVSMGRMPDGADGPFVSFAEPSPETSNAPHYVNRPPELHPIPDQSIVAGAMLVLPFPATDPDQPHQRLTFQLDPLPPGAEFDPHTGTLTWRPTLQQAGTTFDLRITVTDDGHPPLAAVQTFALSITAPSPPFLDLPRVVGSLLYFRNRGDFGPEYHLQTSTDLLTWQTLTITRPQEVPFDWIVPLDPTAPPRFYRVLMTP